MTTHKGTCHCGDVEVSFETCEAADQIGIRTCGCTFCQRIRPIYTSDPGGLITFRHKPGALRAYRFGHETADFVSCARCGTYLGAITETQPGLRCVLNVAGVLMEELMRKDPAVMDFDGEDTQSRDARRAKNWTPAKVEEMA